jgi:hypothetical protein
MQQGFQKLIIDYVLCSAKDIIEAQWGRGLRASGPSPHARTNIETSVKILRTVLLREQSDRRIS